MSVTVQINNLNDYFKKVENLISELIISRNIDPAKQLEDSYHYLNGLIDGWGLFYESLKSVKINYHKSISASELNQLKELIKIAENILYRE